MMHGPIHIKSYEFVGSITKSVTNCNGWLASQTLTCHTTHKFRRNNGARDCDVSITANHKLVVSSVSGRPPFIKENRN